MNCHHTTERFTEWREGVLGGLRGVTFRMHLAICKHCRQYVSQMDATIEALRSCETAPLDDTKTTEVVEAVRRAGRRSR